MMENFSRILARMALTSSERGGILETNLIFPSTQMVGMLRTYRELIMVTDSGCLILCSRH